VGVNFISFLYNSTETYKGKQMDNVPVYLLLDTEAKMILITLLILHMYKLQNLYPFEHHCLPPLAI